MHPLGESDEAFVVRNLGFAYVMMREITSLAALEIVVSKFKMTGSLFRRYLGLEVCSPLLVDIACPVAHLFLMMRFGCL
jgi:hypothetical protein